MPQKSSRKKWVHSCRFHPVPDAQVLSEVVRRIVESNKVLAGFPPDRPLVLLDLDSTLYEVGPRTFRILQEWLDSYESKQYRRVAESLRSLAEEGMAYSIRDLFLSRGLELGQESVDAAFEGLKDFWARRFFTSEYLYYDRPYHGAADYARHLHDQGAEIVYLTGRDEPNMGDGTRANLLRDGFPWEKDRTHLLLKSSPSAPDLDHKKGAADYVRRHGSLVASFENEPVNLVALHDIFPHAMHVFVDTVCSDHEAAPREGLYRIAGFEDFAR